MQADSENKAGEKNITRRDLLKVGAALLGAAGLTQFVGLNDVRVRGSETDHEGGRKWGMLIDINKCIGCNYCTYACQAVNNLADDMLYNVVTAEETQSGEEFFLSRPCMQCAEAPCVHVCPVQATYYRPDGIVAMDYDRCIGCRYCQVACPYGARVFNWKDPIELSPKSPDFGMQEVENRPRGVVEKCHFCSHRIDRGLEHGLTPGVDHDATPACVVACPTGARVFGDLNDSESPIAIARAEATVTLRLREELSTEPRVYYIPPTPKPETDQEAGS
ncbi:sulfate reduction electron transfer complex DsrMKJOP subunit DsrO [Candidatus Villigracilis vicinus]|uniref:sulfate reduction electron transfer complex DsrMKJOP subunit DsrO n=1 Tax=Candidatus Villigracilis vicinus TaxID=3140679 RepID=UPI0031EAC91E